MKYRLSPRSAHAQLEVALAAATRKTVLQIATPSTTDIEIVAWGVSFDGVSPTAEPGLLDLVDVDVAATVTSATPEKFRSSQGQASLCVGGASASGYNASAEGTITDSRELDGTECHPQTGYALWFPKGDRPIVRASRFLRVRCLFAAVVNCDPWVVWEEPPAP